MYRTHVFLGNIDAYEAGVLWVGGEYIYNILYADREGRDRESGRR